MPSRPAPRRSAADRRTRGERTRDRLLEAGATVFADRGLHAARVDDIVKVARTSHGTFYLYFPNKEALFHALAERVAADLEDLACRLPALTDDEAGRRALEDWMQEFGAMYARTGPVIRAWTEAEIVATDVGKLGTNVWASFTGALVDRLRIAGADGMDPAVAALALVAMLERANYYVLTGQVDLDGSLLAPTLARVAQRALFGDRPSPD